MRYTVFDKEICADLGSVGAHCNRTLTEAPRDIPKRQWDAERTGMLCMNSEALNDTETVIEQFCNNSNLCDYETRRQLSTAFSQVKEIVRQAAERRRR